MIRIFETVAEDGLIRLPLGIPSTARCVVTILDENVDTLRAQARLEIPQATQFRMSELLIKNREATLTPAESKELDALAEEFDAATLAKGHALAALAHLDGNGPHD